MHKGVVAIDGRTGSMVWQTEDLAFEGLTDDAVLSSRGAPGNKRFSLLSAHNGHVREEWKEGEKPRRPQFSPPIPEKSILYPSMVADVSSPLYDSISRTSGESGPFSVADYAPFLIVSHYRQTSSGSGQEISVHTSGNREVYRDRILTDTPFVSDAFLIQGAFLYYVREKKELVAVSLPGTSR